MVEVDKVVVVAELYVDKVADLVFEYVDTVVMVASDNLVDLEAEHVGKAVVGRAEPSGTADKAGHYEVGKVALVVMDFDQLLVGIVNLSELVVDWWVDMDSFHVGVGLN